ncbi:MAG: DUF5106 domain-containing protein [Muribaculaceae bacterium]|nr:DUF5106 domain-containing protein [Muribaculaceae bacterium]
MKRILTIIIVALTLGLNARAQEPFFQLPIVPDSIKTLDARTDYLLLHYWDFCDLKKAFSSKNRMAESFLNYLELMPYATAQNAHKSVDAFLKKLEKRPEDLLFIAREAQANLYADTASLVSDELYLPFAQAVAKNKKISKADREPFERHANILSKCQVKMQAPEFEYTGRDGQLHNFASDTAEVVILYFNSPDCSSCNLARVRLDADLNITRLLDADKIKVVSITNMAPDGQWQDMATSFPTNWTVGAKAGIDDIYDIRNTPSFYVLDNKHKIYAKNASIDVILAICNELARRRLPDPAALPIIEE